MSRKSKQTPKQIENEMIDQLSKSTYFREKRQIEYLLKKFKKLTNGKRFITREIFKTELLQETFHFTDDLIMDRIFRVFDMKNTGKVDEEEFVRGLSVFLHGTDSERMEYVFKVYDFNNDGYVTKDDMSNLLRGCLLPSFSTSGSDEDLDEGYKELCEIVLKRMDYDGDHKISFEDYRQAVESDGLLLEILGACFPQPPCVTVFMKETFESQ